MKPYQLLIAVPACFALLAPPAVSKDLASVNRPEDAGFSSERLERAQRLLDSHVEKQLIPGAIVLVARRGRIVYQHAFGYQDRAKNLPMKPDALFRIASMTKPITSTAIMMLAEEGKIDIANPVSLYLPEFRDLKVGVEKPNPATGKPELTLEAPIHAMTVQDLLRHTSGLTYGIFGNSEVDHLYQKANLFDQNQTLADLVTKLSKLPLAHQPGTVWEYSLSTDVLGRLVEVTSGMVFDRFIAERITGPLRMPDTTFALSDAQAPRLALGSTAMPPVNRHPRYLSGGGGLYSTAADYARFAQMLLNGGTLDGVRLLSPKTVALMTSDSLPPNTERHTSVALILGAVGPLPEMGYSFGLGFGVRTDAGRNPLPGSVGDYYWAGITGTYFWVDPQEKLLTVFMVQLPQAKILEYQHLMRELVYQALTD